MDASTLLSRARSALGKRTRYQSPGVTPPLQAATWPESGARCDCSGFLAWCLRISRRVDHPKYVAVNGGWFETTGIHADVNNSWGFFEKLAQPQPGSFLVYPDQNGHDGHIGLVSEVKPGSGIDGVAKVIHCSLGGWNQHGDAIRETDAAIWRARPDSLIGWYAGIL
ncbi:CHAP domain-containing protein [Rhabdaerophilum calidifontis]|uniref:CHAP domain-containing protein n=1 Tax=Rhabdaerophilum calidifontis TaxID=2604328 RepID=UPI00123AD008|nr:CHAP domain-containing protein [Rhabdaerophilum calidifontis]